MISFFQSSGKNRITLFYYTYVRVVRTLLAFAADFITRKFFVVVVVWKKRDEKNETNQTRKKKKEKKEGKNRLLAK